MWPHLPSPQLPWVSTYYFLNSLAFTIAIFWGVRRAQNHKLDPKVVLDLAIVIMLGAFLGARLFHIFIEDPQYFREHPMEFYKFWTGGFVFYGGFIGALVGILIYKKLRTFNFLQYADLLAPVIAFGYGLGRLGCFGAGCCYGQPTAMPWGMFFSRLGQAPPLLPLHPTQLYMAFWEWSLVVGLLVSEKYKLFKHRGQIFGVWLIGHGLGRAIIEQFRDDFRGQNVFNLSISTWISFFIIGSGAWLVLRKRK